MGYLYINNSKLLISVIKSYFKAILFDTVHSIVEIYKFAKKAKMLKELAEYVDN